MTPRMPIIKLEVEHMRHTMVTMLSDYAVQFDEHLRTEVERFCSPENLARIIHEAVESEMARVIEAEVRDFFRYGRGREAIKQAVIAKLEQGLDTKDEQ